MEGHISHSRGQAGAGAGWPILPRSVLLRVTTTSAAEGRTKKTMGLVALAMFSSLERTGPLFWQQPFPPGFHLTPSLEGPQFLAGFAAGHSNNILAYFAFKRAWK